MPVQVRPEIDQVFEYVGYFDRPARCRLRIYRPGPDRPVVVIVSELRDNPGTSIGNAVETIAGRVAREFGVDPQTMLWVEHYGIWSAFGEYFKLVEFEAREDQPWNRRPRWIRISAESVERMIGGPLGE